MRNLVLAIPILILGIIGCEKEEQLLKVQSKEIQIGNQIWASEPLTVEVYLNGDSISTDWEKASQSLNSRAVMKKVSENNCLYSWYVLTDPRGLIPEGWRIPTKSDWEILIEYLGGKEQAGRKLKSTLGWEIPNEATNESNFSAIPTGIMSQTVTKSTTYAYYWTLTEYANQSAYFVELVNSSAYCSINAYNKQLGLSIRLIKE